VVRVTKQRIRQRLAVVSGFAWQSAALIPDPDTARYHYPNGAGNPVVAPCQFLPATRVKVGKLCNTNDFAVSIVLGSCAHATSSFEMDLAAGIVTRSGTHLWVTQPTITGSKSWPDTAVVSFP
jgi:hypothetical protein